MSKKLSIVKSVIVKVMVLSAVILALSIPGYERECSASAYSARMEYEWTVKVDKGYLALRTEKAYDSRNEIGELYTGDGVEVLDSSGSEYWYVYAPILNKYGYVNRNYLIYNGISGYSDNWTVKVDKGYLALRTQKAYDSRNEIGELYTGDEVEILNSSDSEYWYVYAPGLEMYGYVNKNYLTYNGASRYSYWSVKVDKGYLALRTQKAYNERNEIGELYTGDVVEIEDDSDSQYWYVYAPILGKSGYVNKDYLVYNTDSCSVTKTVRVSKGYLALRTSKAYDTANEIGGLYTGDTVEIIESDRGKYWYVYAPALDKYGYVNKDYLY